MQYWTQTGTRIDADELTEWLRERRGRMKKRVWSPRGLGTGGFGMGTTRSIMAMLVVELDVWNVNSMIEVGMHWNCS